MALNKFLIFEVVNISNGETARVKNYYSNNFVVLIASTNNAIANIKPGMTITGQSSGYSKTLTQWNYSTVENQSYYDVNYNNYAWQNDFDNIIVLDYPLQHTIVEDDIYNTYPHTTLSLAEQPSFTYEIIDYQLDEMIKQDG